MILWTPGAARKLATAICEREGINVRSIHDGETPRANWDTRELYIPNFNPLMAREYMLFMHHEISHLFKENKFHWDAWLKILKEIQTNGMHPVAKNITNIIMDYLCEKSKFGVYQGRDKAISDGRYDFDGKIEWAKAGEERPLITAVKAVDLAMRADWQCEIPVTIDKSFEGIYLELLDFHYETRVHNIQTADDIVRLVKDIIKLAEDYDEEDDQQNQQQQQGDEDGDDDGDGQGQGGGGGSFGRGNGDGTFGPLDRLPDTKLPDDGLGDGQGLRVDEQLDHIITKGSGVRNDLRKAIEETLGGLHLSKSIQRYLYVMSQSSWSGGLTKGKLHGKNLHRAVSDRGQNPRIYKQKNSSRINKDTAVSFLCDMSGSMAGQRYVVAAACTILCIEVCQDLRLPVESLGFSHTYNPDIIHLRDFNETSVSRDNLLDRFSSRLIPFNTNADGNAVWYGAERLIGMKERNKLMIVFSDGQPSDGSNSPSQFLKMTTEQISKRTPVQLYGIGINTDIVKHYYKEYSVVNQMGDLESVLINLLKRNLVV